MDVEQKLRIRSNCSKRDVDVAIDCLFIGCLDKHYISTCQRQGIVKLLKLCPDCNHVDGLLYTFEKSTYSVPNISEYKKKTAWRLLTSFYDAFIEEESDQYLLGLSANKDVEKITKALIFQRCFDYGRTFKSELMRVILGVTIQIHDIRKEITLIGEASEGDFWAKFEEKYSGAEHSSNLPTLSEFKSITTYYGNCAIF